MTQDEVDGYNNSPLADFDGLTPAQMYQLVHGPFQDCVIRINELESSDDQIPIIQLIHALLIQVNHDNGLKLTAAGYLPPVTVKELYASGILTDEQIEYGISKLTGEADTLVIQTVRIIAELAGYLRKRHGRLYLTKKGVGFHEARDRVQTMITTFGEKYNIAFPDGFQSEQIGQLGYRYSLYLLKKYGDQPRAGEFYAKRYFRAFPFLATHGRWDVLCYTHRTLEYFFRYFGFVSAQGLNNPEFQKTELLDRFVEYNPSPSPPRIDTSRIQGKWGPMMN